MTHLLLSIACVLLFGVGHLFRDGWYPTGSTHAARIGGALLCGLGAALVAPWLTALVVGAAILAGFYLDSDHAAGQGPEDTLAEFEHNGPRLLVSGLTSVLFLPFALALLHPIGYGPDHYHLDWHYFFMLGAGFAKVFIWPAAYYVTRRFGLTRYVMLPPNYNESLFAPTRVAATVFGMVIAAYVLVFA